MEYKLTHLISDFWYKATTSAKPRDIWRVARFVYILTPFWLSYGCQSSSIHGFYHLFPSSPLISKLLKVFVGSSFSFLQYCRRELEDGSTVVVEGGEVAEWGDLKLNIWVDYELFCYFGNPTRFISWFIYVCTNWCKIDFFLSFNLT